MVEYTIKLNKIFSSLSDPVRRDVLKRVSKKEMSIGEIAAYYQISFAGIAKHLTVLENAGLIKKHRQGKEQIVSIVPQSLTEANKYLENFEKLWQQRLDNLDQYLRSIKK